MANGTGDFFGVRACVSVSISKKENLFSGLEREKTDNKKQSFLKRLLLSDLRTHTKMSFLQPSKRVREERGGFCIINRLSLL